MATKHRVDDRAAVPQDVLALLDVELRLNLLASKLELSLETRVDDWWSAFEDFPPYDWDALAVWLNRLFCVALTGAQYRSALTPMRQRTLADLADLVVPQMRMPVVLPARFGGAPSLEAGAFLVLRELLGQAGLVSRRARPSDPLPITVDAQVPAFEWVVYRLSPELLPTPRTAYPRAQAVAGTTLFLGLALWAMSAFPALALPWPPGALLTMAGVAGAFLTRPPTPRALYAQTWASLGDLARSIARASG